MNQRSDTGNQALHIWKLKIETYSFIYLPLLFFEIVSSKNRRACNLTTYPHMSMSSESAKVVGTYSLDLQATKLKKSPRWNLTWRKNQFKTYSHFSLGRQGLKLIFMVWIENVLSVVVNKKKNKCLLQEK